MILLFTDVGDTVGYGKYAGTYRIATELRANGYPTQVVDQFKWMGIKRLKKILDKFLNSNTLFIGISLTLLTGYRDRDKTIWGISEDDFKEFVNYAKTINPKVKFVVGGFQVTEVSSWPFIDYAVTNKADNAIIALANHLKNGTELKCKQPMHTKIINGDDYFFTQEEFAKAKIVWENHDIILKDEVLPIEVARGCIFKCSFCWHDLIGKKKGDWTKAEDTLYEEIMENYEKFGTTKYMVSDELINESIEKMEMMASLAKRLPFKFEYTSYARMDMIVRYPEMIELFLESGAVGLAFGIETFHEQAGKAVGKGMDPVKIKKAIADCKTSWQDNIFFTANFIIGLPEEPLESIYETIDYLMDPDCPIDSFQLNLLSLNDGVGGKPGNKIGENPEKFGFEIDKEKRKFWAPEWKNKYMTKADGRAIEKQIKNDPKIQEKLKFSSAVYIGRILALGYSIEDIYDALHNKSAKEVRFDTYLKSMKRKEEYYERLMAL